MKFRIKFISKITHNGKPIVKAANDEIYVCNYGESGFISFGFEDIKYRNMEYISGNLQIIRYLYKTYAFRSYYRYEIEIDD